MVLSCLVAPLVSPLNGRGTSGLPRSALSGSRLATTLVAATMLAVSGAPVAEALLAEAAPQAEQQVVRNAHAKPAPLPYRVLFAELWAIETEPVELRLTEAAPFEGRALWALRRRPDPDIARATGPALGRGRLLDQLSRGRDTTFLCFQSALHLSGRAHDPCALA